MSNAMLPCCAHSTVCTPWRRGAEFHGRFHDGATPPASYLCASTSTRLLAPDRAAQLSPLSSTAKNCARLASSSTSALAVSLKSSIAPESIPLHSAHLRITLRRTTILSLLASSSTTPVFLPSYTTAFNCPTWRYLCSAAAACPKHCASNDLNTPIPSLKVTTSALRGVKTPHPCQPL